MVSLTSKGSTSEQQVEAVPTQGGKFSRHCRRRWWVWLIAFCLFVLVIMIIIEVPSYLIDQSSDPADTSSVYAILPAVAQKELNNTYLTVHSLEIRDPTADSFTLSINSTISGASGIASHSRLDPMEVSFYTQDSDNAFMTLPLPSIKGGGDVPVIVQNVSTKIGNQGAFETFAGLLLESQSLNFKIKGRTTIHVGKLHTKVNYNEDVQLKGFNKLTGMEIQKYNLVLNDSNSNLAGKVFIPNPTVTTIEMGNVHISFSLNGTALGFGTIPNLTIAPGDRQYDFNAKLDDKALTTLLSAVISMGKNAALTVKGNGTDIGGTDIPWLSAPLAALEVTVPINSSSS